MHYLYDNVFKMVAVCQTSTKEEVCYPLVANAGSELMQFEPKPGVWMTSGVPCSMAQRVAKRPASHQSGREAKAMKVGGDEKKKKDVEKKVEQKAGRKRVWGKRKLEADPDENPMVDNIFMVHAQKGQVRAYACARCGTTKKLLVVVSRHASAQYLKFVKGMCQDMTSQVEKGVSFLALKTWARTTKANLLK